MRLQQFRFNKQITDSKRVIYRAEDIPRFDEETPAGVTNAEYDCNLTGILPLDEEIFINKIKAAQSHKNDEAHRYE